MRLPWGGLEREAVGAWDRLAAEVRDWGGTTAVISHEILAAASRSQVGRALESLGHQRDGSGVEVHLVLSVRDLVRQIPAEWQENVKHRSGMSYARFLARITDPARNSRIASWFWSVQEVPEILDRWGADLPPERIHLVTVPSPGGAPDLLWKRFSQAFGLEGIDLILEDERVNPSLGVPETALIRRINRVGQPRPRARRLPSARPRAARPPDAVAPGAVATAGPAAGAGALGAERESAFVAEIERRGYDVVGDLHDLRGNPTLHPYVDPDKPRERDVAGAAVDAIKALLLENARMRGEEARLQAELDETRARAVALLPAAVATGSARRPSRASPAAAWAAGCSSVYRLARGRSSRSA